MTEKELWIEQRQIFRSRFTLIFRDYFAIMLADKSAYLLWFKISARANVQEISYRNYNYGNVISMLLLARRLQFIFLCDTWKRNSRKRGLKYKKTWGKRARNETKNFTLEFQWKIRLHLQSMLEIYVLVFNL